MSKGQVKQDIYEILEGLRLEHFDSCQAQKKINKIIDKLFELDTYNYYQCNCLPNQCNCQNL